MTLEDARREFGDLRARLQDESVRNKNSMSVILGLEAYYRRLSAHQRASVNSLILEWTTSNDEAEQYDALALIREFEIREALPILRSLAVELEESERPLANYEWLKVNRLIGILTQDSSTNDSSV